MPPFGSVGPFSNEERLEQCVRKAEQEQDGSAVSTGRARGGREKMGTFEVITEKPLQCGVRWCCCQGRQTLQIPTHLPPTATWQMGQWSPSLGWADRLASSALELISLI